MNNLRQAAQQALEALDQLTDAVDGTGFSSKPSFTFALDTIDALRAALASNPAPGFCTLCKQYTIEEQLPAPAAAAVAEPVARIRCWTKPSRFTGEDEGHAELSDWEDGIEALPDGEHLLYAAPAAPPQREPLIGGPLEQLCEQLGLELYQIRAIERAHGIKEQP